MKLSYIEYIKNNPEGYWFKRKLYGWGWTPARREGWFVTAAYVAIVVALGTTVKNASSDREVWFMFLLPLLIVTAAFLRICYKKGEKPRWQWGVDKKE